MSVGVPNPHLLSKTTVWVSALAVLTTVNATAAIAVNWDTEVNMIS